MSPHTAIVSFVPQKPVRYATVCIFPVLPNSLKANWHNPVCLFITVVRYYVCFLCVSACVWKLWVGRASAHAIDVDNVRSLCVLI